MEYLVLDIVERPPIFNNTGTRFILIAIAWGIPIIAAELAGSSSWQLSLIVRCYILLLADELSGVIMIEHIRIILLFK